MSKQNLIARKLEMSGRFIFDTGTDLKRGSSQAKEAVEVLEEQIPELERMKERLKQRAETEQEFDDVHDGIEQLKERDKE